MTHTFRSISGLASRRRARPVVERATFVVASVAGERFAFPVHWVERVLRGGPCVGDTVLSGARPLTVREIATTLGFPVGTATPSTSRVLVLRDGALAAEWSALLVDAVHEVVAVEIAQISAADGPAMPVHSATHPAPEHPAVRGMFVRQEQVVWVLDPSRLLQAVA